MAGLSGNTNLIASSIQYVINVFMTIFALLFIDRWGRRWPLMIGSTFMAIWMYTNAGLLASYGSPAPPGGVDHVAEESWQIHGGAAKGVIACTYLFVASFAPTWVSFFTYQKIGIKLTLLLRGLSAGSIRPSFILSGMYTSLSPIDPSNWSFRDLLLALSCYLPFLPLRLRGKAVSVSTAANWIFNFALSYFVPPAFVNIKWKVYIVFGVFCTVMTIHVFFMFPETAGKTLEEVEDMFLSDVKAWNTHVEYDKVRREEHGEVDPEKKLSYVLHQERQDSGPTEVPQTTTETVEKNEAT